MVVRKCVNSRTECHTRTYKYTEISKYRKDFHLQETFTEWQVEKISGNQLRVIIWEEKVPLQKLAGNEAILSPTFENERQITWKLVSSLST